MTTVERSMRNGQEGASFGFPAVDREARDVGPQRSPQGEEQARSDANVERLARGLGWFSIGLGLAEILAPRMIARLCGGQGRHTALIRLFGVREIASGIAIFAQAPRPTDAMWARVAGDAMDLAALGVALMQPSTGKAGATFATLNVLGVAALDLACAEALSRRTRAWQTD